MEKVKGFSVGGRVGQIIHDADCKCEITHRHGKWIFKVALYKNRELIEDSEYVSKTLYDTHDEAMKAMMQECSRIGNELQDELDRELKAQGKQ